MPPDRKPMIHDLAGVTVDDLCDLLGLPVTIVRRLVETGEIPGLVDENGRATSIADEDVPTKERWEQLGLHPVGTYEPGTTEVDLEDEDEDDEEPGRWTISW